MVLTSQGENECSYYMKTGHCKFGVTCKFHHPQVSDAPTPEPPPPPASLYPQMQSSSISLQYGGVPNWQVARPPLMSGSYFQAPYGTVVISPGMVPMQSLTAYPVSIMLILISFIFLYAIVVASMFVH